MNTKNKITAIFLAGIMVCLVMAFALPAVSGVTQTATITKNTTAVAIVNQSGLAANTITGWTFTGAAGETNATPANTDTGSNGGELQNFSATEPVAFLNNTDSQTMLVYLTADAWNDSTKVGNENYTNSAPASASDIDTQFTYNTQTGNVAGAGLASNAKLGLWLKLELEKAGTVTSAFTVESEVK